MRLAALLIVALHVMPLWAMIPMPVSEVPVTKKVSIEGYVNVASGWQWNGEQFRVDIAPHLDHTIYDESLAKLVFSNDQDYREALRNNGFVVRVEGIRVCRGPEKFVLVESIRTAVR